MKICDLHSGVIQLSRAAQELREHWSAAAESWTDQNRREFEEQHVQPLGPQVARMVSAVHRLREFLEKAEHELNDEEREA